MGHQGLQSLSLSSRPAVKSRAGEGLSCHFSTFRDFATVRDFSTFRVSGHFSTFRLFDFATFRLFDFSRNFWVILRLCPCAAARDHRPELLGRCEGAVRAIMLALRACLVSLCLVYGSGVVHLLCETGTFGK